MGYISKCEHGTPMALCRKCFPDVSEHTDWSNYKYTHPVKELTDEEILSLTGFKDNPYDIFIEYEKEDLIEFARAILRKAQK